MTTNIIFDHRGRATGGKEGPVEIRITDGGKTWYIATGVRVRKMEFRHGEIVNRGDAAELNKICEAYRKRCMDMAAALVAEGAAVDGAAIRERIEEETKRSGERTGREMLDWCMGQLPLLNLKDGTRKRYLALFHRMEEYKRLAAWDEVTVEGLCDFDAWLHTRRKPLSDAEAKAGKTAGLISDAGVYTYHRCLKALLNRAVLFGKIDRNPYDRLRGKFKRGDVENVEYLTRDEMDAVESLHPLAGSKMAAARDLFVFQMHTGLSYADTQTFDYSAYREVKGRMVRVGEREKTGVQYVSVLDDTCMEILRRYGHKLPSIDNSDYNLCLKAIGMAAGIEKPLHSHIARHTFATQMLADGARIENVSKMLGHTNIKQTQRYAKVLAESVIDDFVKAEDAHRRTDK